MRRTVFIAFSLLSALLLLPWCGSGEDSTTEDIALDVEMDAAEVETYVEPRPEWEQLAALAVEGANWNGVKGLTCNNDWLYLSVDGPMANGLYGWQFGLEMEFQQVFTDSGPVQALESGVVVSHGASNEPAALAIVDTEGTITDLGFANEQLEIRQMNLVENKLFLFSKDWSNAQYLVHRGILPDGGFQQIGGQFVDTGMSMFATPDTVYALTAAKNATGTACFEIPSTDGPDGTWLPCNSFPDYSGRDNGPFSVIAELYGNGGKVGAWFRVSDKGNKSWKHYVNGTEGWAEVGGFPEIEPATWFHDGTNLYIGLTDSGGKAAVHVAAHQPGAMAEPLGEGLPPTAVKTGVTSLCRSGEWLFLAWLDYNPGGSTVTIWRRTSSDR